MTSAYDVWKQCERKAQDELRDLGMTGQSLDEWYTRRVQDLYDEATGIPHA